MLPRDTGRYLWPIPRPPRCGVEEGKAVARLEGCRDSDSGNSLCLGLGLGGCLVLSVLVYVIMRKGKPQVHPVGASGQGPPW